MAKRHRLVLGEVEHAVTVAQTPKGVTVTVDGGDAVELDLLASRLPGLVSFMIAGRPYRAFVTRRGGSYEVTIGERRFVVHSAAARRARSVVGGAEDVPGQVTAPLAGVVVAVRVAVGDVVEAGTTAVVLEAMKMQNEVQVPHNGTITAVHVAAGANVEKAALLIEYEPAEDGGE